MPQRLLLCPRPPRQARCKAAERAAACGMVSRGAFVAQGAVSMVRGVIVCEQEFDRVVEYPTQAEFDAFATGFQTGAGKYGGDGALILTRDYLPEYEGDLKRYSDKPTGWLYRNAAAMVAIINEHLPEEVTSA
jgi:hypothetical protein